MISNLEIIWKFFGNSLEIKSIVYFKIFGNALELIWKYWKFFSRRVGRQVCSDVIPRLAHGERPVH
jgi:hypothetical protein